MAAATASEPPCPSRESALESLAASAAANIPGADFVSIPARRQDGPLRTVVSTDPLAEQTDMLQYELREGPCYAAVTKERFVLVNDLADSMTFPDYGPKAVALGIGAQAGIQLLHQKETAGLKLYARTAGAFDRSTVQLAELFATQAGALLGYADQVEQLSVALHTRTDIGTAVGIFMERYHLDRHKAFAFLARCSQNRNIKVRIGPTGHRRHLQEHPQRRPHLTPMALTANRQCFITGGRYRHPCRPGHETESQRAVAAK
jgi:hypothetical protein